MIILKTRTWTAQYGNDGWTVTPIESTEPYAAEYADRVQMLMNRVAIRRPGPDHPHPERGYAERMADFWDAEVVSVSPAKKPKTLKKGESVVY